MTVLFMRIQNNAATFWSESILKSKNELKFNFDSEKDLNSIGEKIEFQFFKKNIQMHFEEM